MAAGKGCEVGYSDCSVSITCCWDIWKPNIFAWFSFKPGFSLDFKGKTWQVPGGGGTQYIVTLVEMLL